MREPLCTLANICLIMRLQTSRDWVSWYQECGNTHHMSESILTVLHRQTQGSLPQKREVGTNTTFILQMRTLGLRACDLRKTRHGTTELHIHGSKQSLGYRFKNPTQSFAIRRLFYTKCFTRVILSQGHLHEAGLFYGILKSRKQRLWEINILSCLKLCILKKGKIKTEPLVWWFLKSQDPNLHSTVLPQHLLLVLGPTPRHSSMEEQPIRDTPSRVMNGNAVCAHRLLRTIHVKAQATTLCWKVKMNVHARLTSIFWVI